jgi:hypothetical protein
MNWTCYPSVRTCWNSALVTSSFQHKPTQKCSSLPATQSQTWDLFVSHPYYSCVRSERSSCPPASALFLICLLHHLGSDILSPHPGTSTHVSLTLVHITSAVIPLTIRIRSINDWIVLSDWPSVHVYLKRVVHLLSLWQRHYKSSWERRPISTLAHPMTAPPSQVIDALSFPSDKSSRIPHPLLLAFPYQVTKNESSSPDTSW